MFICSSDSKSEASASEHEHVTSTVPELIGVEVPEDIKSGRSSWLHRLSRTPSPYKSEGRSDQQRDHRAGKIPKDDRSSGDEKEAVLESSTRKPRSYQPVLIMRENEVHGLR